MWEDNEKQDEHISPRDNTGGISGDVQQSKAQLSDEKYAGTKGQSIIDQCSAGSH